MALQTKDSCRRGRLGLGEVFVWPNVTRGPIDQIVVPCCEKAGGDEDECRREKFPSLKLAFLGRLTKKQSWNRAGTSWGCEVCNQRKACTDFR